MPVDAILAMREDHRRAMHAQIVHDAHHGRGLSDAYLLRIGTEVVGYGAVAGDPDPLRDVVKEFFVVPARRGAARALFQALLDASGARRIDAQTNDTLLLLMLLDRAQDWTAPTILFADGPATHLEAPGVSLRRVTDSDRERMFAHTTEPVGEWGLERDGAIVATGGLLFHYNPPFADLFMEVASAHRGRGYARYLVQELRRIARERGAVPAARCRADNPASRGALEHGGMVPCARIVRGRIADGPAA